MSAGISAVVVTTAPMSSAAATNNTATSPPETAASTSSTRCEGLEALHLSETIAISAELVTSGQAEKQSNLPEFCRVKLTVSQAINIEVWLPTTTYNNRFQAVGGGGWDGFINYGAMAGALRQGYATSSTDSGHVGSPLSGAFAFNADGTLNDQLIKDYGSRGIIEMTLKAKQLIPAFYGTDASYSYFNGCSNGGRQGLLLAQQLPDAYDGIVAGSPAISMHKMYMSALWPYVASQNELGGLMSNCKLAAFDRAVVAHCDAYDGVVDGIIGNPKICDFDPDTLIGQDFGCGPITAADAKVVKMAYAGPTDTDGKQLWSGFSPGLPLAGLLNREPDETITSDLRWAVGDRTFDWHTLTYAGFAEAFRQGQARFGDVLGADNPDLRAFKESGGKLVMTSGTEEYVIPRQITDYYDRVVDVFHSAHQVGEFARLFMVPGMFHCGGGPGPNVFDSFGALRAWVEQGTAPDSILASRIVDGQVVRTQPLCSYPKVARYDGRGDVNAASSYHCRPNYGNTSAPNN